VIKAMIDYSSSAKDAPTAMGTSAKSLMQVQTVYVNSLGTSEGAQTIRAKLENLLAASGRWSLAPDERGADAILRGVGSVQQQFAANDGSGGTYFQAVLAARLLNQAGEVLWTFQASSRPSKRTLLTRGFVGSSATSSVAEQAVKSLMKTTNIAPSKK
jgi:hypothetical protein